MGLGGWFLMLLAQLLCGPRGTVSPSPVTGWGLGAAEEKDKEKAGLPFLC